MLYVFSDRSLRFLILLFFLLSLGLSPFYFWKSGAPQISHILMAISIGLHLTYYSKGHCKCGFQAWWYWAFIFAAYTLMVNVFFYLKYGDPWSLVSTAYYIFNAVVFVHVLLLAAQLSFGNFLRLVNLLLLVLLAVVIVFSLSPYGRHFGGYRMMGLFNDPNQFAHWLLWISIIIPIIGWALRRSWMVSFVAFFWASAGIYGSLSRSGLLGLFVVILAGFSLIYVNRIRLLDGLKEAKFTDFLRFFVSVALAIAPFFIIGFGYDILGYRGGGGLQEGGLISSWVDRVTDTSANTSFGGRGYDRLWKFPQYLLLGAGEGANERWLENSSFSLEIHSTFFGVVFSYGVFGLSFLMLFLFNIWRRLGHIWMKLLMLAPMAYSLGTYNLRSWFFWIGLALLYVASEYAAGDRAHLRIV